MTVLSYGNFPLGINKIVLVPGEIIFPILCASCPISFANEFYLMALVSNFIQCLYSRNSVVVGSMNTLA